MRLPSESDLLAAIDALGKKAPNRPQGKGWYTIAEMAKQKGLEISAMRWRFAAALRNGLQVERCTGSDYDATGRLVKQTWFRVKR